MSAYEVIIKEISEIIGTKLHPENNSVTLTLEEEITVIIELAENRRDIMVAIPIGKIGPGRFREIFLTAALKYNGHDKAIGTFGFSEIRDTLMFYQFFPLRFIKGKSLWSKIQEMKDLSKVWKDGLNRGVAPTSQEISSSPSLGGGGGGMFGLK